MKKAAKAYPGGKEVKIHNPSGRGVLFSLGLPERNSIMAKKANAKKKGGSKKKKKSNPGTASAKSTSTKSTPKKSNPKKKGGAKRASRRNPLPSLGSVGAMEWAVFALAAIGSRAITSLITNPDSWGGIGLQAGLTILAGKFAPKGVRTAATFGAGGGAVVSVVNRLTNNAIQTTITQYLGKFIPPQLGAGAGAGAGAGTGAGLAGYRGPRAVTRRY